MTIDDDDRRAIADELLDRLEPGLAALKRAISARLNEDLRAEVHERLDRLRDEVLRGHSEWLAAMHEALSQRMDDALNGEGDEWKSGRHLDWEEG